jgi:hypothetical protein
LNRVRYLIGVATLVAVAVGGYLLLDLLHSADRADLYTLRLEFRDVLGLRTGADVRYRGVPVGMVQRIQLRPDGERATVDVAIERDAEKLVRYGSRFWIVSPRFLGLTQGASGLDTLIRDSYLSFATGAEAGPELPSGSQLLGSDRPPPSTEVATEAIERGDLVMTLLVPENHDLVPGAPVMFLGIQTGEVRAVRLAGGGTHVEVELRVRRAHRQTVTDRSQFWVARPRLSGALLTGLSLQDAAALLSPFIGYHTSPGDGVPVADGHRAAALPERPDVRIGSIPASALTKTDAAAAADPVDDGIHLVRVFYQAVERDFWSPDDEIEREGCGLLLDDGSGRRVVLTTRSSCDGTFFVTDTFGRRPDIDRESIRVALREGQVLQAARAWTATDGTDLALLVLADPSPAVASSDGARLDFAATAADGAVVRAVDAQVKELPAVEIGAADLGRYRGGSVVVGQRVVGILGQAGSGDERPTLVPLAQLPAALRPKQ